jgi:C4-dicarboxylate transporter, DctQ subunit
MLRAIYVILAALTSLAFMGAMAITFVITMTRYLIGFSDPTAEYLSRYLVIAGAFLGFPLATLAGINVRFDLLDVMVPPRVARLLMRIAALVGMMCCGVLAYASWLFVDDSMLFGEIMPTGFPMPLWIAHSVVLLGFVLATVAFLIVAVRGPLGSHDGPAP